MTEPKPQMRLREDRKAQTYDRDKMVKLYVEHNHTVAEVARLMNAPYSSTYNALKARRVLRKPGRGVGGGRPRSDTCKRGHDQSVWRREDGRGGGYCGKCKTMRDKGQLND